MQLHFYTTYDNIQMLREGDSILVWSKDLAQANDVHVSLDTKKYSFDKAAKGIYSVSLI